MEKINAPVVIEKVACLVVKLQAEEPGLRGFRHLEKWSNSTYPKDLNSEDSALLKGAIYLEALRLIGETPSSNARERTEALSLEGLREVFRHAPPLTQFDSPYLDNLLKSTKRRIRKDPEFKGAVLGGNTASKRFCVNGATGADIPFWLCAVLVILILALWL